MVTTFGMTDRARKLVESFYSDVWNRRDKDVADRILAPELRFRGSLGLEKAGISGFLEYVELIHSALGDYQCEIDDLVVDGTKVAAKMTFRGNHRRKFLGVAPTHREIAWKGAAFFSISGTKISEIWVLGDIEAIKAQLSVGAAYPEDPSGQKKSTDGRKLFGWYAFE